MGDICPDCGNPTEFVDERWRHVDPNLACFLYPAREAMSKDPWTHAYLQARKAAPAILRVSFDVSKLTPEELDALILEVVVQAEASDGHPDVDVIESRTFPSG